MGENKNLKGNITAFNTYHTDAYMIAVRNGFEGTEAEWLESLKAHAETDTTLTKAGVAADAKYVGELFTLVLSNFNEIDARLKALEGDSV